MNRIPISDRINSQKDIGKVKLNPSSSELLFLSQAATTLSISSKEKGVEREAEPITLYHQASDNGKPPRRNYSYNSELPLTRYPPCPHFTRHQCTKQTSKESTYWKRRKSIFLISNHKDRYKGICSNKFIVIKKLWLGKSWNKYYTLYNQILIQLLG